MRCEHVHGKMSYPDPDARDFQILMVSSSSTDTFTSFNIKMFMKIRLVVFVSCSQTDRQTNKRWVLAYMTSLMEARKKVITNLKFKKLSKTVEKLLSTKKLNNNKMRSSVQNLTELYITDITDILRKG